MGYYNRAVTIVGGCLALGLLNAGTDRDPDEVLKEAAAKVRANTNHAREYTCVETVERNYYRPMVPSPIRACSVVLEERDRPVPGHSLRLFATDRLRLDVTLTNHDEIYSWAGASKFDTGIDSVVKSGPIGSGAFGAALDMVFNTDVKKFHFEGERLMEGAQSGRLMEYSFRVAKSNSNYMVRTRDSWIATAYLGSVFINPETDDLVRLRIETVDVPAASGSCQDNTTLEFAMAQTDSAPFMLPVQTLQRFIYPNGNETENTAKFANCREYHGESTITFNPPASSLTRDAGHSLVVRRPEPWDSIGSGLAFTMELLEPIDTDQAAAGDLFRAKLVHPLKDRMSKTIAPAGSIVEGRLRRVESRAWSQEVYVVFAPRALWVGEERVPFEGTRNWNSTVKEHQAKHTMAGLKILMPLTGEAPAGVFSFPGQHIVVPRGFRSEWWTVRTGIK